MNNRDSEEQDYLLKSKNNSLIDYKAVTFTLAGKDYGVDIMSVREISRGGRFTFVPNTPHFVRGVYNLRGEIIPIVDLRDFFSLPVNKEEKVEGILICRVKETTLGLVVDSIEKVIGINRNYIQPAHPMFADVNIQYIDGIIDREDRLYVLLNIHQIFGIAKDLIDESESLAAEVDTATLPTPKIVEPAPVVAQTEPAAKIVPPAVPVAPSITQFTPPMDLPAHEPTPDPEPFLEPTQEHNNQADNPISDETANLIALLNAMPEPTVGLVQPDIESLLEETRSSGQSTVFQGSNDLFNQLSQQLYRNLDFRVTSLNEEWIIRRANHYLNNSLALTWEEEEQSIEFLAPFFSESTGQLWSLEMMEDIINHLTPQEKGIYHVWNPGCAAGHESYSILGALLTQGITTTPKIYAQDLDLIAISSAAQLSFNAASLPTGFDMLTIVGSNGLQFKNEYKNQIIFDFADIRNTSTFPGIDLIIARDTLSYLTTEEIEQFIVEASEMTEIGTIMVLGENEKLENDVWRSLPSKKLSLYRKIK